MKGYSIPLLMVLLSGCASSPSGANWAVADFNKYDRNYASFDTQGISSSVGLSKEVQ